MILLQSENFTSVYVVLYKLMMDVIVCDRMLFGISV